MNKGKITILGIGNLLMQDEGIGIHVIEELKKDKLPDNVELVDGAASGFDLLPVIESCDKLIVIDAIKTDDEPGSIYCFDPRKIDIQRDKAVSLHDVDFFQVLDFAGKHRHLPAVTMITIVPEKLGWGMELSPRLKSRITEVKRLIINEINKKN